MLGRQICTVALAVVAALASLILALPATAQTSGLVAGYSFAEGSGTTVADVSGNNNRGTLGGGVTWTTQGKFGNALVFNGASFVTIPAAASLNLTTAMTLEAWIYPTTAATNWSTALMREQPGEFVYTLYVGSPSNSPNVFFNTGASSSTERGVAGPSALPVNTWSHLAGTYDGAVVRLYVNGAQVASRAFTGTIGSTTGALRIGGNGVWGEYFTGRIDEVRIYNRALTPAEVQADMNTAVSGAPNTAPTISSIAPQTVNEDTATGAISFTVGDAETAPGSLTVTGSSSNPTLAPNGNVVFGGSGANRTVTVTPAANQNGTATITVTVSDGQQSTSTTFQLTVNAVNDPPTITSIAHQTTSAGTAVGPISFTVGDIETPAASLTVSGSSSNQPLVPDGNIAFGGAGANRTVTVTPAAGQTGTATITVTVSDGQAPASTAFQLTVNATPAGLVAGYSFAEGAGTTVTDVSGNNNRGTLGSGVTWTTQGKFGSALVFNGAGFVTIPSAASLNLTAMTLEAWIYPTATPTNWTTALMREQPGELVYTLYAGSPANRPNVIFNTGTSGSSERSVAGPGALPLNTWSHLAGTYDGATLRLYVNGTQVASQAFTGSIVTSTGALRIGGNGVWGEYFTGRIDEVRIYNRALTPAEILSDVNAPVGGTPPPDTTPPTVAITTPTGGATY